MSGTLFPGRFFYADVFNGSCTGGFCPLGKERLRTTAVPCKCSTPPGGGARPTSASQGSDGSFSFPREERGFFSSKPLVERERSDSLTVFEQLTARARRLEEEELAGHENREGGGGRGPSVLPS